VLSVCLSVNSQFTTNSKCRLSESKHAWTRLFMECRTLLEGLGAFANGLIDLEMCWLGAVYLQLDLCACACACALGVLSVCTGETVKD
jgi:hypothetical protein